MDQHSEQFRVNHLPPFHLGEIARSVITARNAGKDIVDLSQLNPTLSPPSGAVEKLVQACLQPHNHRYSSSQGILKLREEISEFYRRRFSVDLDPAEEIVVTLGTKQGLSHLLFAVLNTGDSVLLPSPAYPIHSACISLAGARSISVQLPLSGSAVLDADHEEFFSSLTTAFESSWPRPVMLVLSFPHNPTASVATSSFFERVSQLARGWGVFVVHDFAYADLAFDGFRTPSFLAGPNAKQGAIEFFSFSKGLSMPGWRIGAAIGDRQLVGALKKIKSFLDCGVFQPLQIGAMKALQSAENILSENADLYQSRRDVLVPGLRQLGFELSAPTGSLFVWAKLPGSCLIEGSLSWSRRLLDEALVAVAPGAGFDVHANDYIRFALVESESRLRLALSRMETLLRNL